MADGTYGYFQHATHALGLHNQACNLIAQSQMLSFDTNLGM